MAYKDVKRYGDKFDKTDLVNVVIIATSHNIELGVGGDAFHVKIGVIDVLQMGKDLSHDLVVVIIFGTGEFS